MQEQAALKDIVANPYRGLATYPIQEQRKAQLKESVETTGLWPRLMGRRNKKGKIELAYGHHLLAALIELYGPNHKIPIEVRDISDQDMFRMMARENARDWDTSPLQDLATVKELLAAIDRGEIKLPKGKLTSTVHRFAIRETTGEEILKFLGWNTTHRIPWIVEALDLLDAKLLKQSDLEGLNETQVGELIREAGRQRKMAEKEAREAEEMAREAEEAEQAATEEAEKAAARKTQAVAKQKASVHREYAKTATRTVLTDIGSKLRKGEIGAREVRSKAFEAIPPPFPKPKNIPPINQFAHELATKIRNIFGPKDTARDQLSEIAVHQAHLDYYAREMLVGELRALNERVSQWIERIDPQTNNGKTRTPIKSAGPKQLKQ